MDRKEKGRIMRLYLSQWTEKKNKHMGEDIL
jgi:hypothetical protein